MVRVFMKGGVWKNSEDEVLKAAVQKYGKQQWARVASLLNRKTAKQAKARWYEWLDPSIRKTEWSRSEEEKLLHLAKLLPAQWKTIAPIVGRTATQCQDHYESLLDQAAAAAASSAGDATSDTESMRKQSASMLLRPGQIDSHPETRPARPDPIDMDDDELEMLQEARARLANTQGKKAKRKQREKVLAQAKRLADLQKRRELKQAGLMSKAAKKKAKHRREIDLGVEVPFYKPAPAGFHDTSQEQVRSEAIRDKRLRNVDFQKVNESRFRSRDFEEAQRKKRQEKRLQVLEQENQKYIKAQKEQLQDQQSIRPRGILQLPTPTVSDRELGDLAKLQQQHLLEVAAAADGGSSSDGPTQALLGSYPDLPRPSPSVRTSTLAGLSAGAGLDHMSISSRLPMPDQGLTPFLAATAAELEEDEQGVEKNKFVNDTALDQLSVAGRTTASLIPLQRDELGLNYHLSGPAGLLDEVVVDSASIGASTYVSNKFATRDRETASVGVSTFASTKYSVRDMARQERLAAKRARLALEKALSTLPAPQFEYELDTAPLITEQVDSSNFVAIEEKDKADLEAAELVRLRKESEKRYEARSSVLKRKDLPRPTMISDIDIIAVTSGSPSFTAARAMIQKEMESLIQHDARTFPLPAMQGKSVPDLKKNKRLRFSDFDSENVSISTFNSSLPSKINLDDISAEALVMARERIASEVKEVYNEKRALVAKLAVTGTQEDTLGLFVHENTKAAQIGADKMIYTQNGWLLEGAENSKSSITSLEFEFDLLHQAAETFQRKNKKLQSKLSIINGGYEKRSEKLRQEIMDTSSGVQNSRIEFEVYKMLQEQEIRGSKSRIEKLCKENADLRHLEASLQKQYGELMVEKRRLEVLTQR